MIASILNVRCLLLFIALVQSVSLYKIYPFEDEQLDLSSLSLNEKLNEIMKNSHQGYDDSLTDALIHGTKDYFEELKPKSKRSISNAGPISIPHRRNSRPHWNPLIAAYKRCGELSSHGSRENCFKDAVQMLFVHKLRK